AYGRALALLKREGRCPSDVEHRQIKYRNNVIECDHGKLKRIIGATLGFKSMKTAYATIKGIEVAAVVGVNSPSAMLWRNPSYSCQIIQDAVSSSTVSSSSSSNATTTELLSPVFRLREALGSACPSK
ncbi:transposase, partial [Escherichia coli]|uniref:transposase n=1 Tax=Escherichia coli TaxID=562 RepID=UPI00201DB98D